jgi:hypothetical protein
VTPSSPNVLDPVVADSAALAVLDRVHTEDGISFGEHSFVMTLARDEDLALLTIEGNVL